MASKSAIMSLPTNLLTHSRTSAACKTNAFPLRYKNISDSTLNYRLGFFKSISKNSYLSSLKSTKKTISQNAFSARQLMRVFASEAGSDVRVRFAPSPTGNLHVGGARTALFNWLYARHTGGKFIVRVEDTDTARSTRESEEAMIRDLRWLGLDWDEGPDKEGDCGPYRQSEREHIYKEYADKLVETGAAYPCFCTDEELEAMRERAVAMKLPPKYTGKWRSAPKEEVQAMLDSGAPHTYRFRVPDNEVISIDDLIRGRVSWNTDTVGDFVLLRSSGVPVYNFCVAVDDATMGITHVLRAEEHLPNTLRQMLVYQALGFEVPQFGHMSLILAPDKSKLSKRHGATSVGDFKAQGYLPEAMVNYLSLLGWNDGSEKEIYTNPELVQAFSLDRITKSPAVFDKMKLNWMNGQHLRALPEETAEAMIGQQLVECGLLANSKSPLVSSLCHSVLNNLELLADVEGEVRPLFTYPLEETMKDEKAQKVAEDDIGEVVRALLKAHKSGALGSAIQEEGGFKKWLKEVGKQQGRKGKRLFMPIRILLTGRMQGPDVGEVLDILALSNGEVAEEGLLVELDARMATLEAWAAPEMLKEPEPVVETPATEESTKAQESAPAEVSAAPAKKGPPDAEEGAQDRLDIRVGRVIKAWKHPDAESLFVEEVDVGEPEPRTICSGLVGFVEEAELQGRAVIVLCNLKPRNMVGVKSNGMLMAASNADHTSVQLLTPPEEAPVGERVRFGSLEGEQGEPDTPNRVQKKKVFESVQPDLTTSAECVVQYKELEMLTSAGKVVVASLPGASVS